MATDYNLLGSTEVLEELQEGRTRELLLLLQDKPVPEVQDPMNVQSGFLQNYQTDGNGDYQIKDELTETVDWSSNDYVFGSTPELGLKFTTSSTLTSVEVKVLPSPENVLDSVELRDSNGTAIETKGGPFNGGDVIIFNQELSGTYTIVSTQNDNSYYQNISFPLTSTPLDVEAGILNGGENSSQIGVFQNITGTRAGKKNGQITDRFEAPTTPPTDFKQWNAIQARDVTAGGSSSAEPVEFEILDSTDTTLNSTQIPKARIADEPFTMRNRVYTEDAGSDGQSDYQIATTGDGGHFGIPIFPEVVWVKHNGSFIDTDNYSFYADTKTVEIDTSNVTIASGDTIEIKYDFDVFDSTLQPRVYLSRESTSETSPSISHFRYEYVI